VVASIIHHGPCRPRHPMSASLDEIQVLPCVGDSAGEPFKICRYRTMYLGTDDEKPRLLDDNEIDGPLCKFEGLRPIVEAERIDGRRPSVRHDGPTLPTWPPGSLWSDLRISKQNAG
jgi:hypothetical protein